MSSEELVIKQPIKRLEIAIGKFNDVAIPYHLELLKRHKNNVKRVSTRICYLLSGTIINNRNTFKIELYLLFSFRAIKNGKKFIKSK